MGKIFSQIFNYLWRFWFVFLAFTLILIFAPFVLILSIREKYFPKVYIFIRLWSLIIFYGMGFRYTMIEKSHRQLDKRRNYILISNHTSVIDIMLMAVLHPHHPICFIGKLELAKIPLFGIIYKRICILVDRNDVKSRARVYSLAAERIKNGQSLVIFPEGGVPDDESVVLDSFKDGAFSIASEHDIPIVVYSFSGLKKMFPFRWNAGFPGNIEVTFHGILQSKDKENMKKNAWEMIRSELKS